MIQENQQQQGNEGLPDVECTSVGPSAASPQAITPSGLSATDPKPPARDAHAELDSIRKKYEEELADAYGGIGITTMFVDEARLVVPDTIDIPHEVIDPKQLPPTT